MPILFFTIVTFFVLIFSYCDGESVTERNYEDRELKFAAQSESYNSLGSIAGNTIGGFLGSSIALSADGSKIASGAYGSGYIVVYAYDGSALTQMGSTIWGPYGGNDEFGWTISLSADGLTLAVGAPLDDNGGEEAGRVYIYIFTGGDWSLEYTSTGTFAQGWYGNAVALSGDGQVLAIGAPKHNNTLSEQGGVFILNRDADNNWPTKISYYGAAAFDQFGNAVALSYDGTVCAVGARYEDYNSDSNVGAVRVFVANIGTGSFSMIGSPLFGETAYDTFGWSVALSTEGTFLAVGAPYSDIVSTDAGYVKCFNFSTGSWIQRGGTLHGGQANYRYGYVVKLSSDGKRIIIGGPDYDTNSVTNAGRVSAFDYVSDDWESVGWVFSGAVENDRLGMAVDMSCDGTRFVWGRPNSDEGASNGGKCHLYSMTRSDGSCYVPTALPTDTPTLLPTDSPTLYPTFNPSSYPTFGPSLYPTFNPSSSPSSLPTSESASFPTRSPTRLPITSSPTPAPTFTVYTVASLSGTLNVAGDALTTTEVSAIEEAMQNEVGRSCKVELTAERRRMLRRSEMQSQRRLDMSVQFELSLILEDNTDLTTSNFFSTLSGEISTLVSSGDLSSSTNAVLNAKTGGSYTPLDVNDVTSDESSVSFKTYKGSSGGGEKGGGSSAALIGGAVGGVCALLVVAVGVYYWFLYRKQASNKSIRKVRAEPETEDTRAPANAQHVNMTKVAADVEVEVHDTFLTHCWGMDTQDRDNHKRVAAVNAALKSRGVSTWFDEEQMEGHVAKAMTSGIDKAKTVIVFVTRRYIDKVKSDNAMDNCQIEFNYACQMKKPEKMLVVVFEKDLVADRLHWKGPLGAIFGTRLFIDMSFNFDGDQNSEMLFNAKMDELVVRLQNCMKKTRDD